MRRTLALSLAVPFFASLFACTAILGNFDVGTTPADGGTDGGGDVAKPDGGDGGPDGGPPQPMKCDPNGTPSTIAKDPSMQKDRVWIHTLPGNQRRYRVVTIRNQQDVEVYTVNDKLDPPAAPIGMNAFEQNFNIAGVASYDGGFIVLADVDKGGGPRIDAMRFDDNADVPGNAFTVISAVAAGTNSDFQFSLAPIDDVGKHDFFLAYSYKLGANAWQVDTHQVTLQEASNPLPVEPTSFTVTQRPGGFEMLLAKASNQAFVLIGGDQGQGALQLYVTDFQGKLSSGPTILKGPNGATFFPLTAISATGPDDLNAMAIGQGDLNNVNIPLGIRAGTFSGQQLTSSKADPNTLPPLVPLTVDQLAVDKGNGLWQFLPVQGPQYTSAARNTGTGTGVNLNWFDGTGRLRGLRAGSTALFPTESIEGAAAAIDGQVSPLLTNLVVAYTTSSSEIRIGRIACLGK